MHGSMGGGRKPTRQSANAARRQAPPAYPTTLCLTGFDGTDKVSQASASVRCRAARNQRGGVVVR
jgi:hypothetical protein